MEDTFWHKQTPDKPLFPDMIWNKPENRVHAGKLLIIGGNAHEFSAPAEAYNEAMRAGAGAVKVLLPNVLQKTVGAVLENGEFAPSNRSGSFSKQALGEWLEWAHWADGVLIAGDLGRNSETAVALESFVGTYGGILTITKDALDYFNHQPRKILEREHTTFVGSLAQLQKYCSAFGFTKPVRFAMTAAQLAELLHELTQQIPAGVVVEHNGVLFAALGGKVCSTRQGDSSDTWRVATAAHSAVWTMQNPDKQFQAITTSIATRID